MGNSTPVLTKDRTLIAVDKLPGDWDTCTDPEATREVATFRRAANAPNETASGRPTFGDVTLTRFYDTTRDAAIIRQYNTNPGVWDGLTLTLTDLASDGNPMAAPLAYVGSVKTVSRTGSDANSNDQTKLTVVLTIARAA